MVNLLQYTTILVMKTIRLIGVFIFVLVTNAACCIPLILVNLLQFITILGVTNPIFDNFWSNFEQFLVRILSVLYPCNLWGYNTFFLMPDFANSK